MLDIGWYGLSEAEKIATMAEWYGLLLHRTTAPVRSCSPPVCICRPRLRIRSSKRVVRAFYHGWYQELTIDPPPVQGERLHQSLGQACDWRAAPPCAR
jgi:hypothetical protein